MSERDTGAQAVISQTVRPEFEAEFARWQGEVSAAARQFPGFESTEIVRPQPGVQDDWVIVYRFDTAENLAAYLFRNLGTALDDSRIRVAAVTLWETDRACVRYAEDHDR